MIGTRVAFRGAFGPHEGIVLEETEDSVILKVEKNDTLGNRGQVTLGSLPGLRNHPATKRAISAPSALAAL
jgi:hypothetical protein